MDGNREATGEIRWLRNRVDELERRNAELERALRNQLGMCVGCGGTGFDPEWHVIIGAILKHDGTLCPRCGDDRKALEGK